MVGQGPAYLAYSQPQSTHGRSDETCSRPQPSHDTRILSAFVEKCRVPRIAALCSSSFLSSLRASAARCLRAAVCALVGLDT